MTARAVLPYYMFFMAIGFFAIYTLLGVRELGLYYSLGALNLPASILALPLSEFVAGELGIRAGSTTHVYGLQIGCMVLNSILIARIIRIFKPNKDSLAETSEVSEYERMRPNKKSENES